MEQKQDYFRSPHLQNIPRIWNNANHCSPLHAIKDENGSNQLFQNNLFNSDRLHRNSPFHLYAPRNQLINQNDQELEEDADQIKPKNQISGFINFPNNEEGEANSSSPNVQQCPKTPEKKPTIQIIENTRTTARKKYTLRDSNMHQKSNRIKSSEKGLRGLSRHAAEVLRNSEPLTYQEVALKIIQQNSQIGQLSNKKQSQSIKRRVYDALNVQIAVGLLIKNGKKISYNHEKNTEYSKNKETKNTAQIQIQERLKLIRQKKVELIRFRTQLQSLAKLMDRNRKIQIQPKQEEKIYFPFIIGRELIENDSPDRKGLGNFICADLDAISKL